MAYDNTRLIKEDALFRGGEPKVGSQYDAEVLAYINRVYFGICSGASEFVPEFIDDWWWMRANGSLLLQPIVSAVADLTQNSTAVTFSANIATDLTGYQFKADGWNDRFYIASHTPGTNTATLDLAWTGPSVLATDVRLGKVRYTLDAAVQSLMAPMSVAPGGTINGVAPEVLDAQYQTTELLEGIPAAFALEDERTVRFSHAGRSDGFATRIDYIYRPVVTPLTDSTSSIPLIPAQFRHVLADGALAYLRDVKGDSAAANAVQAARQVLVAMMKENRRRITKLDRSLFHIYPRMAGIKVRSPISTEA